jgi:hypothetical protein
MDKMIPYEKMNKKQKKEYKRKKEMIGVILSINKTV